MKTKKSTDFLHDRHVRYQVGRGGDSLQETDQMIRDEENAAFGGGAAAGGAAAGGAAAGGAAAGGAAAGGAAAGAPQPAAGAAAAQGVRLDLAKRQKRQKSMIGHGAMLTNTQDRLNHALNAAGNSPDSDFERAGLSLETDALNNQFNDLPSVPPLLQGPPVPPLLQRPDGVPPAQAGGFFSVPSQKVVGGRRRSSRGNYTSRYRAYFRAGPVGWSGGVNQMLR